MIHVAPCSCELHVRIRELEEEKAYAIEQWRVKVSELEAGGDALFEECKKQVLRAEKAEARVAELSLNRRDGLRHSDDCPCGFPVPDWVTKAKSNSIRRTRSSSESRGDF